MPALRTRVGDYQIVATQSAAVIACNNYVVDAFTSEDVDGPVLVAAIETAEVLMRLHEPNALLIGGTNVRPTDFVPPAIVAPKAYLMGETIVMRDSLGQRFHGVPINEVRAHGGYFFPRS